MYCEKAVELIKELNRNREIVPPYNNDLVDQVCKELSLLANENCKIIEADKSFNGNVSEEVSMLPSFHVRQAAIERNLRCLLSYHYNRIKSLRMLRWEFGSILPSDIKSNLSPLESTWFSSYSSMLAKYMRSLGEEGGLNLCIDLKPPKSLYIEVRCLVDYGKHQLNDGSVILLKKNTRYYLPRTDCEEFIRLQIFEHIF